MLKTKNNKKDFYELIGISACTLNRELKRNSKWRSYDSMHAQIFVDEPKRE